LGISITGNKRGLLSDQELNEVIHWMTFTNAIGEQLGPLEGVHAMTDVTGFGLLGHLNEMNRLAQAHITLDYAKIPVLASAKRLASQFVFPDITTRNFNAIKNAVSPLNGEQMLVLCDPQTSGGLLISASSALERELIALAKLHKVDIAAIGKVGEDKTGRIEIL
jgi:selenide,water dikinase